MAAGVRSFFINTQRSSQQGTLSRARGDALVDAAVTRLPSQSEWGVAALWHSSVVCDVTERWKQVRGYAQSWQSYSEWIGGASMCESIWFPVGSWVDIMHVSAVISDERCAEISVLFCSNKSGRCNQRLGDSEWKVDNHHSEYIEEQQFRPSVLWRLEFGL